MRKFSITVNGQAYEVEVEELERPALLHPLPRPLLPVAAPAPVAAPVAAPKPVAAEACREARCRRQRYRKRPDARQYQRRARHRWSARLRRATIS